MLDKIYKIYNKLKEKAVKDPRSKCWIWPGGKSSTGYGMMQVGSKRYKVHRLMYWIYNGVYPGEKLVRHTCDNRLCFNPNHLILGTHTDNINDMVKRKRHKGGRVKGVVKVTTEKRVLIKHDRLAGYSISCIARKYGISRSYVDDIIHDRKKQK